MTEPAEAALGVAAGMRYLREAIGWYERQGDVASTDEAVIRLVRALNQALEPLEARRLITPVVERLAAGPAAIITAAAWNELARTHLFTGDYEEALGLLDRGLGIAERLGAYVTIAELLVSKSWALSGVGRPREAAAIVLGGLDMAERAGSFVTTIRARVNASNWYLEEDPRRALEIAAAGIELARSVGHAEWAAGLSSNASQGALTTGDWDRIVAWRDELDGPSVSTNARLSLHGWAWVVDAYRGVDPTDVYGRPLAMERVDSFATQERGAVHAIAALVRFAAGDLDHVLEPAMRAYREYPEVEGIIALLCAGRAAILRQDATELRLVLDELGEGGARGAWLATRLDIGRSALGWLEDGQGTAEPDYRDAIETFRTMGLHVEVALSQLELLALGGEGLPDHDVIRDQAVRYLQGLGVGPLLDRVTPAAAAATPVPNVAAPVAVRATSG
jgi:tetratricopeptide (TPR) repeat protein